MKTGTMLLFSVLFTFFLSFQLYAQVIFTENFESGTANANWWSYYKDTLGVPNDNVTAVPMANAPVSLAGGGNYVGWLQDVDASYTGSAVAVNGSLILSNYSIEADVFCYVNHPSGSAYTGLVVYADTTTGPPNHRDFYKLRADFDGSNRINFSGLKSDPITFQPLFSKDFKGIDNPGLFPTLDGWHKMKIEVRASGVNETKFWCYFDGTLLAGCPITDTASTRNISGSFGLYTFQMDANGIPGYFDNIVVNQLSPVIVEDYINSSIPADMHLSQNYPNPFNPTTKISWQTPVSSRQTLKVFDVLGNEIVTLVDEEKEAGNHSIDFDASNLPSGVYFYQLRINDFIRTKKMLLLE